LFRLFKRYYRRQIIREVAKLQKKVFSVQLPVARLALLNTETDD